MTDPLDVHKHDGDPVGWVFFARVRRDNLARTLAKLYARGYSPVSINVTDAEGERLEPDGWPRVP